MLSRNKERIIAYLKNSENKPTINQLSRELEISVGSAHKILKEFEQERVVKSEVIGNAIIYSLRQGHPRTHLLLHALNKQKLKKKTKIICTIGPATNSPEIIKELILAGMDVARINGSHGSLASNKQIIDNIRAADSSIPILLDLPGQKIRLGDLAKEVAVHKGDRVVFTTDSSGVWENSEDSSAKIPVYYPNLLQDLKGGSKFLIDDGNLGFAVESIGDKEFVCKALNQGFLKSRKGFNFPETTLSLELVSSRDKELIDFAHQEKLNFIGVSFAGSREHLQKVKEFLHDPEIKLIAKIENRKGIENYEEIIDEAYAIMIDRGDLGSEIGMELVPALQKRILKTCNLLGKPAIVATQMLDSMVQNLYPTKAEINDVANNVLDGATALMLSAETAVGKYPLESVKMMVSIITPMEDEIPHYLNVEKPEILEEFSEREVFSHVIADAVAKSTQTTKVDKVICLTSGGYSARMVSSRRLRIPLLAVTSDSRVFQRLNLLWGVERLLISQPVDNSNSAKQKKEILEKALQDGLLGTGDTVIITGAIFPNNRKITNFFEIHKVSEALGFLEKNSSGGRG